MGKIAFKWNVIGKYNGVGIENQAACAIGANSTMFNANARMYPITIAIKIDDVLIIPVATWFKTRTMLITNSETAQFLADPKSDAPLPPAIDVIPVGSKDNPIVSTTVPVTIFGKNRLNGRIKKPSTPPKRPPTKDAPSKPEIPYTFTIDKFVGKKPKLVPMTIGSLAPTFQRG